MGDDGRRTQKIGRERENKHRRKGLLKMKRPCRKDEECREKMCLPFGSQLQVFVSVSLDHTLLIHDHTLVYTTCVFAFFSPLNLFTVECVFKYISKVLAHSEKITHAEKSLLKKAEPLIWRDFLLEHFVVWLWAEKTLSMKGIRLL